MAPNGIDTNGTNGPATLEIPRGPVTVGLIYFVPPIDGSKPYHWVEKQPDGKPQDNFGTATKDITIQDVRGQESSFSLQEDAFEAISGISSDEHDFTDDAHIKKVYYPEVEQLLLDRVPGANRILIFDHTIRRTGPDAKRTPAYRVHIDQTPASAAARVHLHLPEEADALLQSRFRIINVWRPLNGPVYASPLAFASADSVENKDLVGVEHRYPNRTGETAGVYFNEGQKWYYWSGMQNDERLLLQCSDSDSDKRRVPHTAFVDPRTPQGAPGRESVEVRALVFG